MTFALILAALSGLFLVFINTLLAHKKALRDAEILFAKRKLVEAERLFIVLNDTFIPKTKSLTFLLCSAINRNAVSALNYIPENQSAIHLAKMSKNIFSSLGDHIDKKQDTDVLENFILPTVPKEIEFFREYIRTLRRFLRHEMKLGTIAIPAIENEINTINFLQIRLSIDESIQNAKGLSGKISHLENNIYIDNVERLLKSPYLTEYPAYLNRIKFEIEDIKRKWKDSSSDVADFEHQFNSPRRAVKTKPPQSSSDGLERMLEDGLKPKLY